VRHVMVASREEKRRRTSITSINIGRVRSYRRRTSHLFSRDCHRSLRRPGARPLVIRRDDYIWGTALFAAERIVRLRRSRAAGAAGEEEAGGPAQIQPPRQALVPNFGVCSHFAFHFTFPSHAFLAPHQGGPATARSANHITPPPLAKGGSSRRYYN